MRIIEINIENHFTSTEYDPSPHRFSPEEKPVSERTIPIIYSCENCEFQISFKTEDFSKHLGSLSSNLKRIENIEIETYLKRSRLNELSRLDFHCPNCKQATLILYEGGPSGYWGIFGFKIKRTLVLKE